MIIIRSIREEDAEPFLAVRHQLDQETHFMLLEPGERTTTVEQTREQIQSIKPESQVFLVAETEGKIVGYLFANGGTFHRNRSTASIVVGILQAYTGQGIGRQLFHEVEDWAREHSIHRLELTVMSHNERAIALYKKVGFEIEGVKKHSLFVDGVYVDEYYMGKLLN